MWKLSTLIEKSTSLRKTFLGRYTYKGAHHFYSNLIVNTFTYFKFLFSWSFRDNLSVSTIRESGKENRSGSIKLKQLPSRLVVVRSANKSCRMQLNGLMKIGHALGDYIRRLYLKRGLAQIM